MVKNGRLTFCLLHYAHQLTLQFAFTAALPRASVSRCRVQVQSKVNTFSATNAGITYVSQKAQLLPI